MAHAYPLRAAVPPMLGNGLATMNHQPDGSVALVDIEAAIKPIHFARTRLLRWKTRWAASCCL
jgi:hypothetical protein